MSLPLSSSPLRAASREKATKPGRLPPLGFGLGAPSLSDLAAAGAAAFFFGGAALPGASSAGGADAGGGGGSRAKPGDGSCAAGEARPTPAPGEARGLRPGRFGLRCTAFSLSPTPPPPSLGCARGVSM